MHLQTFMGILELFLMVIASDKIKCPTSGKWSELCDCNYCSSLAFKCYGDVRGARVEKKTGFVSTEFWPNYILKRNKPSSKKLLSGDNDSLSHFRAAIMQILFWNGFQSKKSLNNRFSLKHDQIFPPSVVSDWWLAQQYGTASQSDSL